MATLRSDPRVHAVLPEQGAPLDWTLLMRPAQTREPLPQSWVEEAWKAPLESSCRRLGVSKISSGELLEAPWRLPEPSWRLLESLAGALGMLGAVLEASWEALGRSWSRLRGVLEAPRAVLEPS